MDRSFWEFKSVTEKGRVGIISLKSSSAKCIWKCGCTHNMKGLEELGAFEVGLDGSGEEGEDDLPVDLPVRPLEKKKAVEAQPKEGKWESMSTVTDTEAEASKDVPCQDRTHQGPCNLGVKDVLKDKALLKSAKQTRPWLKKH